MKNKFLLKIFLAASIAVSSLSSFSGVAFASNSAISQEDFMELLSGYVASSVDADGYINLDTFTQTQKEYFVGKGEFFRQFVDREQTMISFTTDSSSFSFEYKKEDIDDGYIDIFVDNNRVQSTGSSSLEDEGEFSYTLDGGEHRVDVYLPRGGLSLRNFKVDSGATVAPIEGRTKALFYGDSITYGYLLGCWADSYVNVLARQMNYEVVNYGVGGYVFDGGQVISQSVYTPDVIFVAYGTNDVSAGANTPNVIATNGKAFLDNVRALYPTQHIYVVTPIWANDNQNRIDYLDETRTAIETLCADYQDITVIDGLPLVPESSAYFADGVHPNISGNRLYGNNLASALKDGSNDNNESVKTGKGWSVKYEGQKTDRNTYFANTTEAYSFSSGKSMNIQYPDAAIADTYVEITGGTTAAITAGTYEISFYVRNSIGTDAEVYIGDDSFLINDMTKTTRLPAADVPSGEGNRWRKYTLSGYEYTGEAVAAIKFRIYSNTPNAYIDDISISGSDGVNLITDPSFDGVEEVITEVEPFDTTNYQATRMMASSGVGLAGLSWRNPETTDLSKVSVYNVTDGESTLVIDSLSTTPADIVVYPVTGLTDGKTYVFMVKFDFANGAAFKYYMSCTPGTSGYSGMLGSWNVWEYAGGTATYTPTDVSIDNEVFHSGEAAMKFTLNLDTADDPDLAGNNYIRVYQENLTLDSNSIYEVKMWLKCQEMGNFNLMMDWNSFSDGVSGWAVQNFGDTMDWREYTFHYDTTNGNVTYLNALTEAAGIMWIDDVSIYKLDEEGNPTGDNLIKDGGFEELLDTSVGDLENAFVTNIGTNEMTLNWEATSSKISSINIYEKLFDNYEYRGTVAKGVGSVDITGLAMGTEYSYKLVPVNSAGVEDEGIEITAETEMPDYTVKEPVLKKGNFAVTEVSGTGSYTVTTEVKNFAIENMPYLQCVAVYKDGALEKIYPTEKVIPVVGKNAAAQKVSTSFTIEGDGEYSVKVYIFDDILSMNSYIPKKVFE